MKRRSHSGNTRSLYVLTARRSLMLLCAFAVFLLYLTGNLFRMMFLEYDAYQDKVIDQITVGGALKAERGQILDRYGNVLATSKTVWRVYVTPSTIRQAMRRSDTAYDEVIAEGVASILDSDPSTILSSIRNAVRNNVYDYTLARNVDQKVSDAILTLSEEKGLSSMLHTEASSVRCYPEGTLASHVLGFSGSDGQGLYGLELSYNSILTGTDGKYLSAIDARGQALPNGYGSFIPAVNGLNIVTTIDPVIQRELEHQLETTYIESGALNRTSGVVMNVKTGEVLAMAVYPAYNPNEPYVLDGHSELVLAKSGLDPSDDAYKELKKNLLYEMWNNKTISETYEPGSTFKAITAACALEEKVVTAKTSTFTCTGRYNPITHTHGSGIACHKKGGHGAGITFEYGLQQSCNPTMMQVMEKIGGSAFTRYFEAFGYTRKTGIDLPSEAGAILGDFTNVMTLSNASFGQGFNVTLLRQLTGISAIANDGVPVTPHLVREVTDASGKTVWSYETAEQARVISRETAEEVTRILREGVDGIGGARNAYVRGYGIAAKTGTSQKVDSATGTYSHTKFICSCVGYAPAEDPEISAIIAVDEPTVYSAYGSICAAPYLSGLFAAILPALGYKSAAEPDAVTVSPCIGQSVTDAKKAITELGLNYKVIGSGDTVLMQVPADGALLRKENGVVLLYTGQDAVETVKVPNVVGKSAQEANRILTDAGLNIHITGAENYTIGEGATTISQSVAPGTEVARGTVITVVFRHTDVLE